MSNVTESRDHLVGFDLGHGETALAHGMVEGQEPPKMFEIQGKPHWPTAYAIEEKGPSIGSVAIDSDAKNSELYIAFKSRPDTDQEARRRLPEYARIVLAKLVDQEPFDSQSGYDIILGCPSGWSADQVDSYKNIMDDVFANGKLTVVKESRAAMMQVFADASERGFIIKGEKVFTRDDLVSATLVVDAGSSTLDFTFVQERTESPFDMGDDLGAGLVEEEILKSCLESPENNDHRDELLAGMNDQRRRAKMLFRCRRAKEHYYQNGLVMTQEAYNWVTPKGRVNLYIDLTPERMNSVLTTPIAKLGGMSWEEKLHSMIQELKSRLEEQGRTPKVVILTGGASRMPIFHDEFERAFPEAKVNPGREPEHFVAKGLVRWGRRSRHMEAFKINASSCVNQHLTKIINDNYDTYIDDMARAISDKMVDEAIMPRLDSWRMGYIDTLRQTSTAMQSACEAWMTTPDAAQIRQKSNAKWRSDVEDQMIAKIMKDHSTEGISAEYLKKSLYESQDLGVAADGMVSTNDPLNAVEGMRSVFKIILFLVGEMLAILFIAAGPLGWIIAPFVFIIGPLIADDLLMDVTIPGLIRRQAFSEAQKSKARTTLKAGIREKLSSTLRRDEGIRDKLRTALESSIRIRISTAIDKAMMMIR